MCPHASAHDPPFRYAFSVSGAASHWERFATVAEYSFAHFADGTAGACMFMPRGRVGCVDGGRHCDWLAAFVFLSCVPFVERSVSARSDAARRGDAGGGGGEWFGYLDRAGVVSQRFKGGPYKVCAGGPVADAWGGGACSDALQGCFHVPRALFMCTRLLRAAAAKLE